ncbi:hypothetical protein Tco_0777292 [Tanacetum coccineum]
MLGPYFFCLIILGHLFSNSWSAGLSETSVSVVCPDVLVVVSLGALVEAGSFPDRLLLDPRSVPAEGSSSSSAPALVEDFSNSVITSVELATFHCFLHFMSDRVKAWMVCRGRGASDQHMLKSCKAHDSVLMILLLKIPKPISISLLLQHRCHGASAISRGVPYGCYVH